MTEEDDAVRAERVEHVVDDMRQVREVGAPDFVLRFLAAIEKEPADVPLLTLFSRLDREASKHQWWHVLAAKIGIAAGTFALLLAILQLTLHEQLECNEAPEWLFFRAEVVFIVITVVAVVPGIVSHRHHRWLLARYRAEQLRLAKWRLLTAPGLAAETTESVAAAIARAAREKEVHDVAELKAWARREDAVAIRTDVPGQFKELPGLLNHYLTNRMAAQMSYFGIKSDEEERRFFTNPSLVPLFFLLSIIFVSFHLVLEGFVLVGHHDLANASLFFLFAATAVPAIWAGVRTWRNALEATRNSMRASAKLSALSAYEERLRSPSIQPAEAFAILACCEGLFAQEQGEWLRLMLEAESYT